MKSCICLLICFTLFSEFPVFSQQVRLLDSGTQTSIRGLSVVSDKIIWVSGSIGKVGRSVDAGKNWEWITVKGFEKKDFRDIEAFDAKTAIIMSIAEPAFILKTTDSGKTWKTVFTDSTKGVFLDAMEFWNSESGIVIGDPIDGRFYILRTFNGGNSWQKIPKSNLPSAETGEGCFASSGTNIRKLDRQQACFVSGGTRSRLFIKDRKIDLPIIQGKESTGANSVAVRDNKKLKNGSHIIVVGGDFSNDSSRVKNACITDDGGDTWKSPVTPPFGYRSCVEYISSTSLVTCGTSGVDVSMDGGMNWIAVTREGFHVCRKAKKGKSIFLAGSHGRIAILNWEKNPGTH